MEAGIQVLPIFDCATLTDIADRFGTPVYFTDFSLIQEKFQQVDSAFSRLKNAGKRVKIFYSIKANSNPFIMKYLLSLGGGLDILSEGELALSLRSKASPSDLMISGTMLAEELLRQASGLKIKINLDSLESIQRGARAGLKRAGIRLNPLIEAGHHEKVRTATSASKFGIALEEYAIAKKEFRKRGLSLDGIHYHIGSGIETCAPFVRALSQICRTVDNLSKLKYLDIGGGYASSKGGKPFDFTNLVNSLIENSDLLPSEIYIEAGRYLVANSTVLLSRVTEVKSTSRRTFVGIDAGFNDMMRTVLYGAEHPFFTCGCAGKKFRADLVGPICESGDVFRTDVSLSAKEGSLVVFHDVGAYGYSLSSNYLTRPRPAEVASYKSRIFLMRKRQTAAELFSDVSWKSFSSFLKQA